MSIIRRSSSLATTYAQTHVSHPGFDWADAVDTFLPQQNAQDVENEITEAWASAKDDKAALFKELQLFRSKMAEVAGKHKPNTTLDVDKCSTNDVLGALKAATARESSGRSSTYTSICAIGKHRDSLAQWVALLPQGDYGSGICAAFTSLLDATERIYSLDKYVFECLASIPAALQKATTYMQVYREQKPLELIKKSVELYKSVLKALTEILQYSQGHASKREQAKRFFGFYFKGDHYKNDLKEAIDDITEQVNAVEEEAKMCQHRRLGSIEEILLRAKRRQEQASNVENKKERQVIDILNSLKDHLDSHSHLDRNGQFREVMLIEQYNPDTAQKPKKQIVPAKELTETSDAEAELESDEEEEEEVEPIQVDELLNLIAYNSITPAQDLAEALDSAPDPDTVAMRRMAQAVNSSELRTFLSTPNVSSVLAIHANYEEPYTMSLLSFLGGQVAQMLYSTNTPIILFYFCSLHSESWDPRASGIGLMASLVGQLLSYPELSFDLAFIDKTMKELLEQDDFVALVQVFLSLLHQLASDAFVFCCIDEISDYQTADRQEDMRKLLVTLVRQVVEKQREERLPSFKLLLTDGGSSTVDNIIGYENVLDLSPEDDEDDVDVTGTIGRVLKIH